MRKWLPWVMEEWRSQQLRRNSQQQEATTTPGLAGVLGAGPQWKLESWSCIYPMAARVRGILDPAGDASRAEGKGEDPGPSTAFPPKSAGNQLPRGPGKQGLWQAAACNLVQWWEVLGGGSEAMGGG